MKLRIVLDLDAFPHPNGNKIPDEAAHVIREAADWFEKKRRRGEDEEGTRKTLRNFESENVGYIFIGV